MGSKEKWLGRGAQEGPAWGGQRAITSRGLGGRAGFRCLGCVPFCLRWETIGSRVLQQSRGEVERGLPSSLSSLCSQECPMPRSRAEIMAASLMGLLLLHTVSWVSGK